nr:MAG TPA: hypothetical protein [Crassvirales sp.]
MGKIKKITENGIDVYPITSTKAVYDENNERLDSILKDTKEWTNWEKDHRLLPVGITAIIPSIENKLKGVIFTNNTDLDTDGNEVSKDGWSCSNYIAVSSTATALVASGYSRYGGGICFYDNKKVFLSKATVSSPSTNIIPQYVNIPNNAKYIKCAVKTNELYKGSAYCIYNTAFVSKCSYPWINTLIEQELKVSSTSAGQMKDNGTIDSSSSATIYKYKFSTYTTIKVSITNTTQLPGNSGLCTVWIVNSGSVALQKYTLNDTGNNLKDFVIPITQGTQVWVQSDGTSIPVVKILVSIPLNEYLNNLSFASSIKQVDTVSIPEWVNPGTTNTDLQLYELRKAFESLCTELVKANILKEFKITTPQ